MKCIHIYFKGKKGKDRNMYKRFYGDVCFESIELLENDIENNINIEYYKTKNSRNYGIEVVKKIQKENKIIVERESIKNISTDETTTDRIINILMQNKVTPVTLKDVVTDLLKA